MFLYGFASIMFTSNNQKRSIMEKKSKLTALLLKVEASTSPGSNEDIFVSLNDSLAGNLRSKLGASNGSCLNNGSCSNNGGCQNNDICNSNGSCVGTRTLPKEVSTDS
jgi:hypothetical protein